MKFFHLSDLHLGKRVNEFSMLEDQKYILNQILTLVKRERPEAVLLAGDIYDKPVPPAEAVTLFDWFLTELAELAVWVFVVSGNHDSPERLAFGARLMNRQGVYLSTVYDGNVEPVRLFDSYGEVDVWLLPFIKPATVRHVFPEVNTESYDEAMKAVVSRLHVNTGVRNILVAHQFVTGAARCESEEILAGGLDNVDASTFDIFDYVALGHIHSPQKIGREEVRYCGTPLKYSISEWEQEKSILMVELMEKGSCRIETIPLKPIRDMRKIKGTYMELTDRSFYEEANTDDYIQAVLTDEDDVPDGLQKLRVIYPNLMRLEYDNRRTRDNRAVEGADRVEEKSELELFEEFYELQNNQPMSCKQREFVVRLIRDAQEKR